MQHFYSPMKLVNENQNCGFKEGQKFQIRFGILLTYQNHNCRGTFEGSLLGMVYFGPLPSFGLTFSIGCHCRSWLPRGNFHLVMVAATGAKNNELLVASVLTSLCKTSNVWPRSWPINERENRTRTLRKLCKYLSLGWTPEARLAHAFSPNSKETEWGRISYISV